MNLPHVFAKSTVQTMELGFPFKVTAGSHWLADDQIVRLRPDLFTQDCRYGLSFSGDEPQCLRLPPDADEPEPTGLPPRRSRAQAASR